MAVIEFFFDLSVKLSASASILDQRRHDFGELQLKRYIFSPQKLNRKNNHESKKGTYI
jgi:hypothetical protein